MTKVAREELDELGDGIDECNVMYLPQVHMPSHRMSAFTDNSPIDFYFLYIGKFLKYKIFKDAGCSIIIIIIIIIISFTSN